MYINLIHLITLFSKNLRNIKMKSSFINLYIYIILALITISCSKETNPITPDENHFKANGLILESSDKRLLTYFNLKTKDTLKIPLGISDHIEVKFLDKDSTTINPPDDKDKKFGWVIDDTSIVSVYRHSGDEWEFHLVGKKIGKTFIEFRVLHNDHPDFKTIKIPVIIQDQSGQHGEAVGLRAYFEEENKLICESPLQGSSGLTKGEFALKFGETTDQLVVKLFDDMNREFQPAEDHKLIVEFKDVEICQAIPVGEEEPWAFQLKSIEKGITQIIFKIAGSDGKIHVEFQPIYVKID